MEPLTIFCANRQMSKMFKKCDRSDVSLADGQITNVTGQGKVFVKSLGISLDDVLCVPALHHNLLSVAKLDKAGYQINFCSGKCYIQLGTVIELLQLEGWKTVCM